MKLKELGYQDTSWRSKYNPVMNNRHYLLFNFMGIRNLPLQKSFKKGKAPGKC
jgi:hypothetical protein